MNDKPPFRTWQGYAGLNVKITLSYDPLVEVIGTLVELDDYGEAILIIENGERRYCWPALNVEQAENEKVC